MDETIVKLNNTLYRLNILSWLIVECLSNKY